VKYASFVKEMYGISHKKKKKEVKHIEKKPSLNLIEKIKGEIEKPLIEVFNVGGEELLKERATSMRNVFYELGDKIENLDWFSGRHADFSGDRKIKDFVKQFLKIHNQLKKHLDKLYPHGKSWDKLHEGYYQWHKLEMTSKEERFMDDLEYELEKVFPGKGKKIGTFIVSIFDIYDSPPNDIGDIVRSGGKDKLIKYAKRTGLKPLKRAI